MDFQKRSIQTTPPTVNAVSCFVSTCHGNGSAIESGGSNDICGSGRGWLHCCGIHTLTVLRRCALFEHYHSQPSTTVEKYTERMHETRAGWS